MGKNSRKGKSDKADLKKKKPKEELKTPSWYDNSPSVSADVGTRKT